MDADQVKTFCESVAQLLPRLGAYASTEPGERTPADDALVRQLRIAASSLANVMVEVARTPPPPMRPRSPNVGAPA